MWYLVPKLLQKYTAALRNTPVSHITSFLLLHEITAVAPLFAFATYFHYSNWLPSYIADWKWVSDGVEKFGRYFRKKGWLDGEDARRQKWWGRGEVTTRLVVE